MNKVSGGYAYEYHLKDHLGNTRVAFQPNGSTATVTQVAEYYPFGSSYLPISPAGTNKYLYSGKEEQDDVLGTGSTVLDWYDCSARFYDPQIGRWNVMDRFAETYNPISPYQYCVNNPLIFTDPSGNSPQVNPDRDMSVYQYMESKQHPVVGGGGENRYNGYEDGLNGFYSNQMFNALCDWTDAVSGNFKVIDYIVYTGTTENLTETLRGFIYSDGSSSYTEGAGNSSNTGANSNDSPSDNGSAGNLETVNTIFGILGVSGDIISKSNWTNISNAGSGVSNLSSIFTTGVAYKYIYDGTPQPITYFDAGIGTAGIISSAAYYFEGIEIPYVGALVAFYGASRLNIDIFYNLGENYGPSTWYGTDDNKWFK